MKKLPVLIVAVMLQNSAHSQFFGGYADGVTLVPTGYNSPIGPPLRVVYDDFTFDLAGDIGAFGMVGRNNTGSPVAIYYEIRTGMSAGNGGTLLTNGFSTGATTSPLPEDGSFGTPPPGPGQYYLYEGGFPGGTFIHLNPGTYWIGLAPLEQFGSFDVTSTSGSGSIGHPIDNGNAFYFSNDASAPANFVSMGANDFGLEIYTAAPTNIPEPNTATMVGLTILGLAGFHKRK